MSFVSEFKEFAVRGNVIDFSVGVIIGAAFGKITTSMVNDILMPVLGLFVGGVNFSNLKLVLKQAQADLPAVTLNYGAFIQSVIDFVIIAFVIFLLIKAMNAMAKRKKTEDAPIVANDEVIATKEELLLGEIRDLLRAKA